MYGKHQTARGKDDLILTAQCHEDIKNLYYYNWHKNSAR